MNTQLQSIEQRLEQALIEVDRIRNKTPDYEELITMKVLSGEITQKQANKMLLRGKVLGLDK